MFEQAFKNIDDTLREDAGASNELDYVEQTSWILFLKYLEDLEEDRATEAALAGKGSYVYIIADKFRWENWAVPKTPDGKIDHNAAMTGDDLKDFVNNELFPYLKKFKQSAESSDTIEYKIGEIFSELKNKIQSGYTLREVLNIVDGLRFKSQKEKHELSHLYEDKIKNMGNAGRNGGEYYTPRPLIKTIVKVVAPEIGNTIYDGAVGSAGFLVEAFEYLKKSRDLTTKDIEILQKRTFYGKEKKSLAYIIGVMNMILHGIEAPNIIHTNTLAENISDIQEKDRFDVILANPPFGGSERKEVQQNFPIKTSETALLFLQHFVKTLKAGGKAGIVIKSTFLTNTDPANISIRKMLMETCNLHTILDLPGGVFAGAGVKTVVLFFEKGVPTKTTWYYKLNLKRNLGKKNPLNENDLKEFLEYKKTSKESNNSWNIEIKNVAMDNYAFPIKKIGEESKKVYPKSKDVITDLEKLIPIESRLLAKISTQTINNVSCKNTSIDEFCFVTDYVANGSFAALKENVKYLKEPDYAVLIRLKDYTNGWNNDYVFVSKKSYDFLKKSSLQPGDLVMSNVGDPGRVFIVPDLSQPMTLGPNSILIKPDMEKALSKYLYYYFLTDVGKSQIESISSGAAQKKFNKTAFRKLLIPLPSLPNQVKIIDKLDKVVDEINILESIYREKLTNLDSLKSSLLNNIFLS